MDEFESKISRSWKIETLTAEIAKRKLIGWALVEHCL